MFLSLSALAFSTFSHLQEKKNIFFFPMAGLLTCRYSLRLHAETHRYRQCREALVRQSLSRVDTPDE